MESLLFSRRLSDYLAQYQDIELMIKRDIVIGTLEIIGDFIYDFSVPSSWHLVEIERKDHREIIFIWDVHTDQAVCPECKTVSYHRVKTYFSRRIQDLPLSGMTVYHDIKANRYFCDNPKCALKTFFEQFDEVAEKDARLTNRLKDYVVRESIESSCHGTSKSLEHIGIKVSTDTINREVKKKGAIAVEQNLQRDDVKILSVDDINLRKGNSSTACSVFIDAETHRVLVIVQGATSEIAERVIQKFPSSEMVSRDRGTAYAAAASRSGKPQVADGFHLVQNIHKVIKDALSMEVPHDLFLREGDGWIRIVDSAYERPGSDVPEPECIEGLVVVKPATLAPDDIETRVNLAGLKRTQATKYKKTMAILELTENGLRTPEIAKRLSITTMDVSNYRKDAPETIESVELKIDEYYQMHGQGQWEYHQRTIANKARLSSESIVEPYKETVLRMFMDGENHRNIYPVIVQEGFQGCANAVYQYIIKYAHENGIPYGRNSRVIAPEERNDQSVVPRPPRISVERTSRNTIYQCLLHVAATRKEEIKQALFGMEAAPSDCLNEEHQRIPVEWENKTSYADSIAKIIFDTKPKDYSAKKK